MTQSVTTLPGIDALKAQARRLRTALTANGQALTHSQALELLSAQYGFRDWNTACAAAGGRPREPFAVGDRVSGVFMSQAFAGEIMALAKLSGNHYRVTVQFDQPVDVVTFDSFSSLRSRVTCVVRENGIAVKKTSNGEPHLKITGTG